MAVSGSVLVVDAGTSGVRASVVRPDASVTHARRVALAPEPPAPGLVELDARRLADVVLELAAAVLGDAGPVAGVGVTNQRATTVVWDRRSGEPVAPAIGWQDLRTVGTCLGRQAEGIRLAPNMSATKLAAILDAVDPERRRADELCFGTLESWICWTLAGGPAGPGGGLHVTDASNVAVTGLLDAAALARVDRYDARVLAALRIPEELLPRIVDTAGVVGEAAALPGAPPPAAGLLETLANIPYLLAGPPLPLLALLGWVLATRVIHVVFLFAVAALVALLLNPLSALVMAGCAILLMRSPAAPSDRVPAQIV